MNHNRRKFAKTLGLGTCALLLNGLGSCKNTSTTSNTSANINSDEMFFKISLAEWSLNREIFGGKLDHLDFAKVAKESFGLDGIEYVNQFFADKAENMAYLKDMRMRASDHGVESLLIMIDREGGLGDLDTAARTTAVENHYKWVDAAKFLGCHSIRVNAFGEGSAEDVKAAAIDGLGSLSTFAAKSDINVIVENHGSYSSDGSWLSDVMSQVNMANCGTLPDFGNFCIARDGGQPWEGKCIKEYDRYLGVQEMMPYAKAVSAKTHNFTSNGDEKDTDYLKMMKIVKDAGFKGWVGIEFEGEGEAYDGIQKTIDLLRKVGKELS